MSEDGTRAAPPSGLTPPRPHDAPLNLPADRSARIARAIAADDAEVSVSGAATAEYSAEEMDRLASIRRRHELDETFPARKLLSSVAYDECHADRAWLLARLDAQRASTAVAAAEAPSPVAGAPEGT